MRKDFELRIIEIILGAFWILSLAGYLISMSGCVMINFPAAEAVYFKSVVVQDEGKARDIMAETSSPLGETDIKFGEEMKKK